MNGDALVCARCVMDSVADPDFVLDEAGICNHCHLYTALVAGLGDRAARAARLDAFVEDMRRHGRGREYDCIAGASGGVDSSWVLLEAKRLGLRPLVVHLDNGWNSELAVKNIELLVRQLGFDLHTHVIDWPEFRDLQVAYLRASVVDIEAITDHAILAALYRAARQHGLRHILTGANLITEGMLPAAWVHNKNDLVNILAIHRRFGTPGGRLRTFPKLGLVRELWCRRGLGIASVPLLDLVHYVKREAKARLIDEIGWRDYGGKHYESVFTRFYQAWILPTKFGIDKRKSHLSTLICAGQLTREEALAELQRPPCSEEQARTDRAYVIKKLGLGEEEFERIMALPPRPHTAYPSILNVYRRLRPLVRLVRPCRPTLASPAPPSAGPPAAS